MPAAEGPTPGSALAVHAADVADRVRRHGIGRVRAVALQGATPGLESAGAWLAGPRTRITVAPGARLGLGHDVVFHGDLELVVRGHCEIGDGAFVNRWCYISAFQEVVIGSGVRLGERVSVHDENHASTGDDYRTAAVHIGEGAWIGAGVVVLPGSTIGAGAVIAAGAVVRGTVPAGALAAGVPARIVRERARDA